MKPKTITIIKIVVILILLRTLVDNPYSYYQILRWIVCGSTGYFAYLAYEEKKNTWAWILGIIAVLFNPLAPFYFDRGTWSAIDIIVAIVIFINIFKTKSIIKDR